MPKYTKAEIEEAKAALLGWLEPGDRVYTILRRVSKSGMSRDISVVIFRDGQPLHPNHSIAVLTDRRLVNANGYDAIRVQGCGMDMGFELVYALSRYLFEPRKQGEAFEANNLKHEWL